ncbi:hypothetical protein FRC01_014424, partial [Tulasnella sp. 417]
MQEICKQIGSLSFTEDVYCGINPDEKRPEETDGKGAGEKEKTEVGAGEKEKTGVGA